MKLPAAQTEQLKGMLESAARLEAKRRYPPRPGAAPLTKIVTGEDGRPVVADYAWHAQNAAERRRIGPGANGSVRVPIFRGMPHCVYREMRCNIRRTVKGGKRPQTRKPNVLKYWRRSRESLAHA